jgi:hypothetical protein
MDSGFHRSDESSVSHAVPGGRHRLGSEALGQPRSQRPGSCPSGGLDPRRPDRPGRGPAALPGRPGVSTLDGPRSKGGIIQRMARSIEAGPRQSAAGFFLGVTLSSRLLGLRFLTSKIFWSGSPRLASFRKNSFRSRRSDYRFTT